MKRLLNFLADRWRDAEKRIKYINKNKSKFKDVINTLGNIGVQIGKKNKIYDKSSQQYFYYIYLIFDLIAASLLNILSKIFIINKSNNHILVYAPYKNKPWILNKIINDLKTSSKKKESYKIFKSLSSLASFKFFKGGAIFLMHQSSIKKCEMTGFNLEELSTFYSHSQINQKGIKSIKKLKKIFCLNNYEYALLNTNGISSKSLVQFPVGINSNFIQKNKKFKNIEDREFDVLFSLRYFVKNQHYKIRKRYSFIINLANLLTENNLKVCILGEDWHDIKD